MEAAKKPGCHIQAILKELSLIVGMLRAIIQHSIRKILFRILSSLEFFFVVRKVK